MILLIQKIEGEILKLHLKQLSKFDFLNKNSKIKIFSLIEIMDVHHYLMLMI